MPNQFTVIVDSREQKPIRFSFETIIRKLRTGDYSIEGLEEQLFIERKGTIAEFYQNCTQKRFWSEMDRTLDYKYRYLILEFGPEEVDNIPYSLNLPKKIWTKMKISPKYIWKCIHRIQYEYQIITLFTRDREETTKVVEDIMMRINENQT